MASKPISIAALGNTYILWVRIWLQNCGKREKDTILSGPVWDSSSPTTRKETKQIGSLKTTTMWLLFPLSNSFVQYQCSLLKFGCNFLEVGKRSHWVSRIKYVALAYHVTFLHCHLYLLPDDDGVDRFAPNTQLLQRSATYMSYIFGVPFWVKVSSTVRVRKWKF